MYQKCTSPQTWTPPSLSQAHPMTQTLSLFGNGQTNLPKNLFFFCYLLYAARKTLTLTLMGHPRTAAAHELLLSLLCALARFREMQVIACGSWFQDNLQLLHWWLLVHFPAMQSGATSNYFHLFEDDASLQRFLWWIMSAICLFFLRDWNQVLLLVDFPAIREQQQAITSISLRMKLLCFFCGYFLCIFCQQSVCSFSKTGITFVFFAALPTITP